MNPPRKLDFLVYPILKFFIFSTIYLLKITKFFVKIPHFEFLVVTEKNIFVYKPFLTLNFQILIYFLCENCSPPPGKSNPLFPSNPTLKTEVLLSLHFWKIWLAVQRPPSPLQNEGSAQYVYVKLSLLFLVKDRSMAFSISETIPDGHA